jgi:hypothetical protein
MNQRAGAAPVPVRARSAALESWREHGFTSAPGSWLGLGPYNVGGRVTALAADPNDSDRVWVGTADGGVFVPANPESESTFVSWRPVFDAQVALSIGSIASHPTDSNTAYVGTGEDNGGGYSYDGKAHGNGFFATPVTIGNLAIPLPHSSKVTFTPATA